MVVSHSSITLFLVAFENECMHLRLNQIYRLVAAEIILRLPPEVLNLTLDFVYFSVNLLQIRAELRINDIIILLSLPNVNALLEHFSQFREIFKSSFKLV